jgi:hypothetical protein
MSKTEKLRGGKYKDEQRGNRKEGSKFWMNKGENKKP